MRCSGDSIVEVQLAGVVSSVLNESDSTVLVRAADSNATAASDIRIVCSNGATVVKQAGWTYISKGEVAAVSPASGQYGTEISITGTGLLGGGGSIAALTLDGTPVDAIISQTSVEIVVVAAAAAASGAPGPVEILADTGAKVSSVGSWSYISAGVVSAVVPSSGQVGTDVVLTGTTMLGGGTARVTATLANPEATVRDANDTHVFLTVNKGTGRQVGVVTVCSNTGAIVTKLNGFEYLDGGVVQSVSPAQGQLGTYVTISGVGLFGGGDELLGVTLGTVPSVVVSGNETRIVVRSGGSINVGQAGDVLVVSDTGAEVVAVANWTFTNSSTIKSVTPSSGRTGTRVLIEGARLLGEADGIIISTVTLAGTEATVVNGTRQGAISVVAPVDEPKVVDLVVEADSGATATFEDGWEYVGNGNVTGVTPSVGQAGTLITIAGSGLLGGGASAASVALAGVAAAVVSSSESAVVVVAGGSNTTVALTGDVEIVASTGAVLRGEDVFTYNAEGRISSVDPADGQLGTVVTIRGTDLRGHGDEVTNVSLAGVDASILTKNNTKVVVTVEDGAAGVGDVVLTSASGALVSASDAFTYLELGLVDTISPVQGQVGTIVAINGTGLLGGASALE
jgi:hypothetical protein